MIPQWPAVDFKDVFDRHPEARRPLVRCGVASMTNVSRCPSSAAAVGSIW